MQRVFHLYLRPIRVEVEELFKLWTMVLFERAFFERPQFAALDVSELNTC
jgi:hypothetical protein